MKTTVNKDGSITTSTEDEHDTSQTVTVTTAAKVEPEAKVVKTPAKATPKTRSTAESK